MSWEAQDGVDGALAWRGSTRPPAVPVSIAIELLRGLGLEPLEMKRGEPVPFCGEAFLFIATRALLRIAAEGVDGDSRARPAALDCLTQLLADAHKPRSESAASLLAMGDGRQLGALALPSFANRLWRHLDELLLLAPAAGGSGREARELQARLLLVALTEARDAHGATDEAMYLRLQQNRAGLQVLVGLLAEDAATADTLRFACDMLCSVLQQRSPQGTFQRQVRARDTVARCLLRPAPTEPSGLGPRLPPSVLSRLLRLVFVEGCCKLLHLLTLGVVKSARRPCPAALVPQITTPCSRPRRR